MHFISTSYKLLELRTDIFIPLKNIWQTPLNKKIFVLVRVKLIYFLPFKTVIFVNV